ncbi:hypothetical protein AMD27_07910 [Acinetobacter sp. TGL-Y2]|uniref:hypothetical protein n=1 Tax=Acinetobacter sp. TGL-Y2 TaxID=1407071 RepID=UPI0007A668B1|nr:hypothetical protein [Acinetobacter sp. TGL-Y2]AMW78811.1 hypothetical protein AMD27_07910 [Acinetobacter sp. TGL-Y2]
MSHHIHNPLFAKHLISGPYERLFLNPGQEHAYIRNYQRILKGEIEYVFRLEEYFNLMVVGLTSKLGNVSLVVIEPTQLEKLPDFIQHTKTMYVVDDIEAVYRNAEQLGIPILQKRTPNIMGAQGRLELAPGYIIELAEATNEALFHPNLEDFGLNDLV